MKQIFVLLFAVIFCAGAWGQAAPAQSPAPQQPVPPGGPMHHPMHHSMHHPMPDMTAQLNTMHGKIADLKTSLAKVKDPGTRQALQADLDLWESMAGHMEAMQKMMPPSGPGMAMDHGCPCCAEMMKQGRCGTGCCGGNKCMQSKPAAPDVPAPPAN